ncbi:hypothetical protein U9M48_043407 [Paspalum notatum var. saurae]|uniref:Uncharacterized protein n=1 Tax=Paspalum notatum var. saurae TaxID=547442 RepID=A0AAQ3USY9_PASNO
METLFVGQHLPHIHRSQKSKIHIHTTRTKHETTSLSTITPGKANVVADALSRKAHCNFIEARPIVRVLYCEIGDIEMPTMLEAELYNLVLEPTIKDQIIAQGHGTYS